MKHNFLFYINPINMKTKTFTLFLIIITFNLSAQQWAPLGAKWYYSMATINPNEHNVKTFESISDTVINSTTCRKIIESGNFTNPLSSKYHYMFSRNDSVFFYANGAFNLLYDFGAQAGDTILLPYFHTMDSVPLKMIIDSVRTININGQSRKIQSIRCGDGIFIEFGSKIIEGIGSTFFMFPTYDLTYDGPIRCYEDAIIGHYNQPSWTMACDTIFYSGIEENAPNAVRIFPNPANNKIFVETPDACSVEIMNMQGQIMCSNPEMLSQTSIDISEFPAGLYLLKLRFSESTVVAKFIKE